MIDMYGQEVVAGDTILTWVKEGSRIIRRDCATFSKFKYQISYGVNGEVISYTFNGYKDSSDLITEHSQDILRLKDKIKSLYENIEDLEFAMLDILTQDEFKFSKEDLGL